MRNTSRKRSLITAAVTLLVLAVVGLVYAQWITNGSGHGYAQAGEAGSLSTIDVSAEASTLGSLLYPGADGDVLVQIHNPNPYPVKVTEISAGAGEVTAAGGTGACNVTGVSLNGPIAIEIAVPAEEDSAETVLPNGAHMSGESETGCQDATFTIPVNLVGVSTAP